MVAAAYGLGTSETTVRQHLTGLYRRTGCVNAAQAAFLLGAGGLAGHPDRPRPHPRRAFSAGTRELDAGAR
jgi:hypothetical protein